MVLVKKYIADLRGAPGYMATGAAEDQQAIAAYIAADAGTNPVRDALDQLYSTQTPFAVNVLDHGADNLGGEDSAAAFQAANDAVALVGGGTVFAPAGNYLINSQVKLSSNVQVVGYGATIRKSGTGYLVFTTSSMGSTGYGSGGRNIAIRGFTFESNFAGNQGLVNAFHHAEDLVLEDLLFNGATRDGHCFDLLGCRNVTIRNCVFRGSLESAGRKYVEAVQVDHSTRSGAGGELVEDPASWDGLPSVNITMESCHATTWTTGGTTYKAPRLIGGHSRVERLRHKNISVLNCTITDSGPTADDGQYQGWIHFIHAEGVRISGCTFTNTLGTPATAIGFQGVTTSYTLDTVGSSSPTLNNAAGSVACENITIDGCTFVGFTATTVSPLILANGLASATLREIAVTRSTFTNNHPGDTTAFDSGATLLEAEYARSVVFDANQANLCRGLVNATNCTDVSISGGRSEQVIRVPVRATGVTGLSFTGHTASQINGAAYLSGCSDVVVANLKVTSTYTGAVPYSNMFSFTGCTGVQFVGNYMKTPTGSQLVNGANFYGGTTRAAASNTMGYGFTSTVRINADSSVVVTNTVTT